MSQNLMLAIWASTSQIMLYFPLVKSRESEKERSEKEFTLQIENWLDFVKFLYASKMQACLPLQNEDQLLEK